MQEKEIPAYNTQLKGTTRSLAQEALLQMLDILGVGESMKPQNLASRRYPMKFTYEFANAVMDGGTGELLEYRHLIQRPKYKDE